MKKRIFALAAATAFAVTALGAPAAAFEPPADPAGKFSCPSGDPVLGHPGVKGQIIAVKVNKAPGAWAAAFAPGPVTVGCED